MVCAQAWVVVNVDVKRLMKLLGIEFERRGRELWAKCPYPEHADDSEPSWSIVDGGPKNGFNNCFGCGRSGGVTELVMEIYELSNPAAAMEWIKSNGLIGDDPSFPAVRLVLGRRGDRIVKLSEPGCLIRDVGKWPSGAARYLYGRGITDDQIIRWHIACAADGDLAGRIWVPTYDSDGRLLDWTARSWCGELAHKCPDGGGLPGAVFGEGYWPSAFERSNFELVVCEGAFDAMACERAGAQYIAATGGTTKIDRWRLMKISTWGRIKIATDPDTAGNRAAAVLLALSRLPSRPEIVRVDLPGMDCDELWKQNPTRLIRLLES